MDTPEPNVLLILSDQHNYRALGRADRPSVPVETSTLDRLADAATVFERTYAPVPAGTPSRLCTLTGREARRCGAWDRDSRLPADAPTLADPFAAAGYETCLVGSLGFGGDRQFAGFDRRPYGDHTGTGGKQFDPLTTPLSRGSPNAASRDATGGHHGDRYDPLNPERRRPDPWQSLAGDAGATTIPESRLQERTVVQESLSVLREHRHRSDRPWLLCASFNRPGYPLTAPRRHVDRYWPDGAGLPAVDREAAVDHPAVDAKAEADRTSDLFDRETVELDDERTGRARAAYAASVDFLDEVLGDFLRSLEAGGFLDNTVVVYASAQGQLLGEHGLWWTGTWHEDAARVPLVVQTPAHRTGERSAATVETPVSLLDLFPTLCGLCDLDFADADGTDLSAAVRTGREPDRGPVVVDQFAPRYGEGCAFRAVRDGREKYVQVRDAPDLRFDLADDPRERENRAETADSDRLRDRTDRTLDFEEVVQRREHDRSARDDYRLPLSKGTSGNSFHLSDDRIVDADTTLYKPDELAHDADRVFADAPSEGE
jgi:choline-sulfatase